MALTWGWLEVAALLGMAWAGLLRPAEAVEAHREDLTLPSDTFLALEFVLVSIQEPKTRLRAARHKAGRVDPPDIVRLIELAFAKWPARSRLWPYSSAAFRTRFEQLGNALGLPVERSFGPFRPLDLGSLRAGGATDLYLSTENPALVQRRGRWVSAKVMDVYIQEVSAFTFYSKIDKVIIEKITDLASLFPEVLVHVQHFITAGIPRALWHQCLSAPG